MYVLDALHKDEEGSHDYREFVIGWKDYGDVVPINPLTYTSNLKNFPVADRLFSAVHPRPLP